jgi:hypothetical protein
MLRRTLLCAVVFLCLASYGGELRVLSTGGERIALAPVVDLRGSPTDEAGRTEGLLIGAFGGEVNLVYAGAVEDVSAPEVWGPSNRERGFAPYLGPAARNGARAVLFVFIEGSGDWSLHLVGVDGGVLEERRFSGSFDEVLPLLTAAAVESFHRHFPPLAEETVARGRLLIRCDGRGFTGALDGNPVGVIPPEGLELRLTAGTHRIAIYDGGGAPLETRFVNIVAADLVVEEFFFGFDVETDEEENDTGEAVASCFIDVLFAAFCTPAGSDDDDDGTWSPGSDDDGEEVWGPSTDGGDDDDDDDGGDVWGPNP